MRMIQTALAGLLFFVFVGLANAAPPKQSAKDDTPSKADPVQVALDHLQKLEPEAQLQWLKQLEIRANRAARLVFKSEEAKQQKDAIYAKLHQKTVTWPVLREVIFDTNMWEKDAIRRLSGQYQRVVFEAFRKDQNAYGERLQAWNSVKLNWQIAGSHFEKQDLLLDWLEKAILSSAPDAIGPLPASPVFEEDATDEYSPPPPPFEAPNKPKPYEPSTSATPQKSTQPQDAEKASQAEKALLSRSEPAVAAPARSTSRIRLQRYDAEGDGQQAVVDAGLRLARREMPVVTVSQQLVQPAANEEVASEKEKNTTSVATTQNARSEGCRASRTVASKRSTASGGGCFANTYCCDAAETIASGTQKAKLAGKRR